MPLKPPIACEYLAGHQWSPPLPTLNDLDQPALIVLCERCGVPLREPQLVELANEARLAQAA